MVYNIYCILPSMSVKPYSLATSAHTSTFPVFSMSLGSTDNPGTCYKL